MLAANERSPTVTGSVDRPRNTNPREQLFSAAAGWFTPYRESTQNGLARRMLLTIVSWRALDGGPQHNFTLAHLHEFCAFGRPTGGMDWIDQQKYYFTRSRILAYKADSRTERQASTHLCPSAK